MILALKGIFCIVFYFGCFFCAGAALPSKFHKNSLPKICLLGFMIYFSAFQIVAFPMKIAKLPLKYLTLTWLGLLGLLLIFVLWKRRAVIREAVSGIFADRHRLFYGGAVLLAAFGLAVFLAMNINHISDFDAGYYLGLPVSSVYSNTIERMDPYTGKMLEGPDHFYLLNTITVHSAVIYQAFNLPPLVEEKLSLTIVMAVLFVLVLFETGLRLMKEKYKEALVFTLLAVLTLLFSYSISGVSHYFAYRTYEGKAICAYFYMTAIFMFYLSIYKRQDENWGWAGLFFAAVSGVATCNTALFTIPVLITTLVLPCLLWQRRSREVKYYVLTILPCLFWLGLHQYLS